MQQYTPTSFCNISYAAPRHEPARAPAPAPTLETRTITSWGRVKRQRTLVARPCFRDELPGLLQAPVSPPILALGAGRSYGDSALNDGGRLIDMTAMDRLIVFDRTNGIVRAEAGITFSALLRVIVPHGWFLPTTPGTRFVTLGGAVANDVHGKNHHTAGTFGTSVTRLGLYRSQEGEIEASPHHNANLFRATIGGLGLTGLITWVEFKLHRVGSSKIAAETIPFRAYDEFLAISNESTPAWEHTVAWIDCTTGANGEGTRGLFSRGNFLPAGPLQPHTDKTIANLPIETPVSMINPVTLKAFNSLYYAAGCRKRGVKLVDYAPFFYPLDAVRNWNRAYGRRGFYQYQCVIPLADADTAIPEMLASIARAGQGSCLAVLKTFGANPSPGMLSFPFEGVTLALDFPNRAARTLELFNRLDGIVSSAKGRLYPAKDSRMPASLFREGFPAFDEFSTLIDPQFQSDFWRRMTT